MLLYRCSDWKQDGTIMFQQNPAAAVPDFYFMLCSPCVGVCATGWVHIRFYHTLWLFPWFQQGLESHVSPLHFWTCSSIKPGQG